MPERAGTEAEKPHPVFIVGTQRKITVWILGIIAAIVAGAALLYLENALDSSKEQATSSKEQIETNTEVRKEIEGMNEALVKLTDSVGEMVRASQLMLVENTSLKEQISSMRKDVERLGDTIQTVHEGNNQMGLQLMGQVDALRDKVHTLEIELAKTRNINGG